MVTSHRSLIFDDFFADRGVDLPYHLRTIRRRWASFIFVIIMNAFASGPLFSWPTLEPILISEGVFAGPNQVADLTYVYTLGTAIGMISMLIAGIFYDGAGPRALCATSAFLIVIGLVVMTISIKVPSLNYLLFYAYPAVTGLGMMNNMAGYAWLFLLPDDQGTVASLTGAIQILSDSLVLLAVWLHDKFGLSLSCYFELCAVLSFLTGLSCLFFIPSQALGRQIATAVQKHNLGVEGDISDVESTSYGAVDSSSIKDDNAGAQSFFDAVVRSLIALKDSIICLFGISPASCIIYVILLSPCTYMFAIYPQLVMYPFYVAFMGTARAIELVNIWAGMYSIVGLVALLVFGKIADYVSFRTCITALQFVTLANCLCYFVPRMSFQIAAQVLSAAWQNAGYYVLTPKYCLSYAPPELYGTVFGLIGTVLGVAEMFMMPIGSYLSGVIDSVLHSRTLESILHFQELEDKQWAAASGYLINIGMYWVLNFFFAMAFVIFTYFYPMPVCGTITMEDVRNVFGAAKDGSTMPIIAKDEQKAARKNTFWDRAVTRAFGGQPSSTTTCTSCSCLG